MRFPAIAVLRRLLIGSLCCAALLSALPSGVYADPDRSAARANTPQDGDDVCNIDPVAVYSWCDLPRSQHIPIRRAFFDRGGYQLYDAWGNVIVVPFREQNLYVMKFCLATDNAMSVVNQGNYPVLYLPISARLKNATVPKAYWYPLTTEFHPSGPMFLSMVPSYDAYMCMGWFPRMTYWGGYWSGLASHAGDFLVPTPDMHVVIESYCCSGWQPYCDYCQAHTPPCAMTFLNEDIYSRAGG
jgi:hypothetical protein